MATVSPPPKQPPMLNLPNMLTAGRFVLAMAAGSILGAAIGGRLPGVVPSQVLLPALAAILVISAVKVWQHK